LRAATDPIDDTSPGKLMEGVLVAFAKLSPRTFWIFVREFSLISRGEG
jgi:hypothetical protein